MSFTILILIGLVVAAMAVSFFRRTSRQWPTSPGAYRMIEFDSDADNEWACFVEPYLETASTAVGMNWHVLPPYRVRIDWVDNNSRTMGLTKLPGDHFGTSVWLRMVALEGGRVRFEAAATPRFQPMIGPAEKAAIRCVDGAMQFGKDMAADPALPDRLKTTPSGDAQPPLGKNDASLTHAPRFCASCGAVSRPEAKFCSACGRSR